MFNFTTGNLIKINPEIFPAGVKDDEMVEALGYPGLFRHLLFEVVKIETDPNRGEIAFCRITNADSLVDVLEPSADGKKAKGIRYEGELVLLAKDVQLANSKITLDYEIRGIKSKEELISDLFVERKKLSGQGKNKSDQAMRANWKKIQILRGEVKGQVKDDSNQAVVFLPKHRAQFPKGITLLTSQLPDGSEESEKKFKQFLITKIRGTRRQQRTKNAEVRDVFGQRVERLGGVFLKERSLLTAYEEFMKTTLETDKKPVDPKSTYFGIEIEMIYSNKYEVLKKLLIENKLHKYVTLKTDGSLRACHNSHYGTCEMTILVRSQDLEDVMQRLDRVLAHPEIDAYANRSCGLHVHLDMRKRDPSLVYKNLVRIQNILRGAQPVGRIKNTHCRVNTIEDYNFKSEQVDERQNRYSVVNGQAFQRHKSIEIRIHEGTTDCEAIYNWALFLESIANHKTEIPKNEIRYAEDLVGRFDVDIPLSAIAYVDERIKRFNSLAVS